MKYVLVVSVLLNIFGLYEYHKKTRESKALGLATLKCLPNKVVIAMFDYEGNDVFVCDNGRTMLVDKNGKILAEKTQSNNL